MNDKYAVETAKGTVVTNPPLASFLNTIFLVLAWKAASYYGLDRYVLPRLGTPWQYFADRRTQNADVTLRTTA